MIRYNGCRMDTAKAIAHMDAMVALVAELGSATVAQLAERLAVNPRMLGLYVTYLCRIGRLEVHQKHHTRQNTPAVYRAGRRADVPLPLTQAGDIALAPMADAMNQRTVGADDWPRGEHARRSGLLAALFPFPPAPLAA